jgi:NADPH-dependent 2,4-dienoyl-CoA reductase/sulfur reductase-like enzyme
MGTRNPPPDGRVVVVGASLAGLRSAEAVRKAGFDGELVIVGQETHLPYNRPPLSKGSLHQEVAAEWLKPGRAIADSVWRLGSAVVASDLGARIVQLESGEVLAWTGLVAATGLRPRRLNLAGPAAGRYALRTLDDARAIRCALAGARSLVVIGAGFIGCELAALAAAHGITTHVVAPESAPIERALGPLLGSEVRRRLAGFGVRFHLGSVPVEYLGGTRVTGVVLSDSTCLDADVVVEAVGSTPNTEWLQGNGLNLDDGVLCDADMRVSGLHDVVACGDVARSAAVSPDGALRRVEHWTTAVDTAKRAGAVLAGHLTGRGSPGGRFAPVPSFWTHQHSLRIQSFGLPGLGCADARVLEGELTGEAAVGYYRDGELTGVVLLGLTARYAHYRREIELASAAYAGHAPGLPGIA